MSGLKDAVEGIGVEEYEEAPEAAQAASGNSVLASLRARAQELATEVTLDLPIPGYGGRLVARYRAVQINSAYADMSQRDARNPINDPGVAADTLARALENLYGINEAGDLEPLQWDVPTRFDDELVTMLGLAPEGRNARSVLVALCGGGDFGRSRVWSHFMEYQAWLMATDESPTQGVVAQAVGEFPRR